MINDSAIKDTVQCIFSRRKQSVCSKVCVCVFVEREGDVHEDMGCRRMNETRIDRAVKKQKDC